jgi:hypothetical protein
LNLGVELGAAMDELRLLGGDLSAIAIELYDFFPKPSKDGVVQMYEDISPFLGRFPKLLADHFLYFFIPLLLSIVVLGLAFVHDKKKRGRSKTVLLTGPSGAGKTGLFAKARGNHHFPPRTHIQLT